MNYQAFLAEIEKYDEFKLIKISQPEGNLLTFTGDVIGKDIDLKFHQIAKKYGLIALADNLSVWASEELYQKYKKA